MTFWLVINKDVWKKLSPQNQQVLLEQAKEIESWIREFAAKERQEDIDFVRSKAKVMYDMTAEEKLKLVGFARPTMMLFSQKQLGDKHQLLWDLLDKAR